MIDDERWLAIQNGMQSIRSNKGKRKKKMEQGKTFAANAKAQDKNVSM